MWSGLKTIVTDGLFTNTETRGAGAILQTQQTVMKGKDKKADSGKAKGIFAEASSDSLVTSEDAEHEQE